MSAFTTVLQLKPSLPFTNLQYTSSRRGDKKSSSVTAEADKKSQVLFTVVHEPLVATTNM